MQKSELDNLIVKAITENEMSAAEIADKVIEYVGNMPVEILNDEMFLKLFETNDLKFAKLVKQELDSKHEKGYSLYEIAICENRSFEVRNMGETKGKISSHDVVITSKNKNKMEPVKFSLYVCSVRNFTKFANKTNDVYKINLLKNGTIDYCNFRSRNNEFILGKRKKYDSEDYSLYAEVFKNACKKVVEKNINKLVHAKNENEIKKIK